MIDIDWRKFRNPTLCPEYQTEEICLEAVKHEGIALVYVENQTENICLEAINQNVTAIRYVKNQTEDICIEAVKKNGYALEFVRNQTEKICLAALKNKWYQDIYELIDIPIEGGFLKEINRMKLINGPMK